MREIPTDGVPIYAWGPLPDEATMAQARHLALLPFAFSHVALMPDAHVGYGMPIGGVLAARDAVVPNAVGLDIGCGVRAWRTGVSAEEFLARRDTVLSDIQRSVPTGHEWHRASQEHRTRLLAEAPDVSPLWQELDRAAMQVGTLGGGNHFIEVQRDEQGDVWGMVHSGSRNLGKRMAEHYNAVAQALDAARQRPLPPEWGLAWLEPASPEGREYLAVMRFCLRFAEENRRLMRESVVEAFARRFAGSVPEDGVDVHHNYAAEETHFGQVVTVHRKGAVRAVGTVIVPGSMGTHSFLGRGLAEPLSFESCSHGAGRTMGRKQAVRAIPVEAVMSEMKAKDIRLFKARKKDVAEEASAAYKDIDAVMEAQRDLVEPVALLTPLGVVKG